MAFRILLVLMIAVSLNRPVAAQSSVDADTRSRTIAPFVDHQTIAVARVDLARLDLEEVWNAVAQWVPRANTERKAMLSLKSAHELAMGLGIQDVYVVASMADLPHGVFVVAPLPASADVTSLAQQLAMPGWEIKTQGRVLLAGAPQVLDRVAKITPDPRPELPLAFAAAGDTALQMILIPTARDRRVVEEMLAELPSQIGGGPVTLLTRGVHWAAVGANVPPETSLKLVIQSEDQDAAQALHRRWEEVVGAFPHYREIISESLVPAVEHNRLVLDLDHQDPPLLALNAAMSKALGSMADSSRKQRTTNHLRQIALAFHNWHDVYKSLPGQATFGDDGQARLSWRVMILPFIDGGQEIYKQFHLDEPWDSPHNRTLIARMPEIYRSPSSLLDAEKGYTNFLRPAGPETTCDGEMRVRFRDILDGTSNTLLVLEVDDDHAVPWTKPQDWRYDADRPFRGLGKLVPGGVNSVFCDGAGRWIELPTKAERFHAFVTPAGQDFADDESAR